MVIEEDGTGPLVRDLPDPVPGPAEILIRNAGSSINGFDRAVATGLLKGRMEHHYPVVIGRDFAGTVEAVASLVGSGALRIPIGRSYSLDEAPAAISEFRGPGKALIRIG